MTSIGIVVGVFASAGVGKPMEALTEANLEPGRGIVGDRYFAGIGTFSEKLRNRLDFQVTLIETEEVERFNREQAMSLRPSDLRRNIVTGNIRLNELVGKRFAVGGAVLEGIRLCEPCQHLATIVAPCVLPALVHRAGLRAAIISGGVVRAGDPIAA